MTTRLNTLLFTIILSLLLSNCRQDTTEQSKLSPEAFAAAREKLGNPEIKAMRLDSLKREFLKNGITNFDSLEYAKKAMLIDSTDWQVRADYAYSLAKNPRNLTRAKTLIKTTFYKAGKLDSSKLFILGLALLPLDKDSGVYYCEKGLGATDAGQLSVLADIYYKSDKFDRAIQLLNKAVAIKPNDTSLKFQRGIVFYDMAKFNNAETDLRHIPAIWANQSATYIKRAQILHVKKEYEMAIKDCETAIMIGDEDVKDAF